MMTNTTDYAVVLLCSETNLKVRQALPCTADMIEIEQLSRFDGQLQTHSLVVLVYTVSVICIRLPR